MKGTVFMCKSRIWEKYFSLHKLFQMHAAGNLMVQIRPCLNSIHFSLHMKHNSTCCTRAVNASFCTFCTATPKKWALKPFWNTAHLQLQIVLKKCCLESPLRQSGFLPVPLTFTNKTRILDQNAERSTPISCLIQLLRANGRWTKMLLMDHHFVELPAIFQES